MQGTNPMTMLCTYSTPCGWCCKWDKKCDKKIGCEPPILKMSYSMSNEALTTIQDEVYKAAMVPVEQLKGNRK